MTKHGFKVMDSDMHVMEPPDLWERYLSPEYRAMSPRGVTSENVRDLRVAYPGRSPSGPPANAATNQGRNFERNQALYREYSRRGWGPDVQLEAMDVEGVDVAVLFPTRGLSVLLRADSSDSRYIAALARAYNDWLFDFCQADTTRLLGAGMISVHDVDHAVEETYRAVEDLGFKAVFLRSKVVNDKVWHDPYWDPLWDALEKLGIPAGLHESSGSSSVGDVFDPNFGLRRVYGQPVGQMLGLGSFLGGGILERHPTLRVAFLEANCSWLPWLLWRLDEGYEREGDVFMPELTMAPSEYFKRQCLVSVEPDELPARHVVEDLGPDYLVFSTDYPHGDSKFPDAVESFLKLPLTDEAKGRILWDNCAQFYGVAGVPAVAR
jgi:predicted TIM-barrel fold metal-dependent hydrolase